MHAVYDLAKTFKELKNWQPLLVQLWKDKNPDSKDVPKELTKWVQNPVITRWWTVGAVARFLTKYWDLLFKMAQAVIVTSTTKEAKNKIASGLYSLMSEKAIKADVAYITAFAQDHLNPNMKWSSRVDKNVGQPGFLTFHRVSHYFVMVENIKRMQTDWSESKYFKNFLDIVETLPLDMKKVEESLPEKYLQTALEQVHKHNGRYLKTVLLLKSAFGEIETSKYVARLLLGLSLVDNNGQIVMEVGDGPIKPIYSPIHEVTINIAAWIHFLHEGTQDVIGEIRHYNIVDAYAFKDRRRV